MRNEPAATAKAEPTSRYATVNGIKLHYFYWGGDSSKRTFLLLHGGGAQAHWWDNVAPLLTSHGRVIALDFRGHGRSQWANPPVYGPASYVRDVKEFVEQLGGRIVLVGHSMGGAVAQWVASEFPDLLDALVIVDAPAGPPPLWLRLMWRWRRRAAGLERPQLASAEHVVGKFRLSPPGTYLTNDQLAQLALFGAEQLPNGKWVFRFDPKTRSWRRHGGGLRRPNLRRITAPTLILRGAESVLVTPHTAAKLNRRIRGSKLRCIERAHHHVPLDNPTDTAAAIVEFAQSL
ncbi:MAG TPA: alpha/beta hydrolase [Candidatus Binataceae bacterium]|jgi:pimeloyl-ACP methyl ester carboxylesterase